MDRALFERAGARVRRAPVVDRAASRASQAVHRARGPDAEERLAGGARSGARPPDGPMGPRFLEIVRELRADRPSDPLLLDALGWVLYRARDTGRARELLEAAVKGAPEEPSLHYHLATVYAQEKKKDRAREELKAALESRRPFAERLDALRMLRENPL